MSHRVLDLSHHFETHSEACFLLDADGDRFLTYGQLMEDSLRLASYLTDLGCKPGDVVLFSAGNSMELAFWYFAALHVGAEISLISPLLHIEEIVAIVNATDFSFVVLSHLTAQKQDKCWSAFPSSQQVVFIEGAETRVSLLPTAVETRVVMGNHLPMADSCFLNTPEKIVVRVHTSGSTGLPKGVRIRLDRMLLNALEFIKCYSISGENRFFNILPMTYLGGFYNLMLLPMMAGASVVVDKPLGPSNIFVFWERILHFSVNTLWFSSSMLPMLMQIRDEIDMSIMADKIQLALVGMAPLSFEMKKHFEDRFHFTLYENYGLSETLFLTSNTSPPPHKDSSVGKPLDRVDIRIVDSEGKVLPCGHEGEIQAQTPFLMLEYIQMNSDDKWERRSFDNKEYFSTGDVGRFDRNGELSITGRIKEIIIRGGINITPNTIERAILRHSDVMEVAVIGMPDAVYGEQIVAFVVLKEGKEVSPKDLIKFSHRHLSHIMYPKKLVILDALPRGATGKVDKRALLRAPI